MGTEHYTEEYRLWNKAVIDHVTSGVPAGAMVYLSIDEHDLLRIRQRRLHRPGDDPAVAVWEFAQSVRHRCVTGEQVTLSSKTDGFTADERRLPRCAGFLAAMVLAAHRMREEEEEEIDDTAYYVRLREILDLPGTGRPPGLQGGSEDEERWLVWNQWLADHQWVPTAEAGAGSHRYIRYPISQALLRQADRDRLEQLFQGDGRFRKSSWDPDRFASELRRLVANRPLSGRLRSLLLGEGGVRGRSDAAVESAYDVYLAWSPRPELKGEVSGRVGDPRPRALLGLYRTEDWHGSPTFWLLPREPRGVAVGRNWIIRDGERTGRLEPGQAGWFGPLGWAFDKFGGRLELPAEGTGAPVFVLPARDFFVLTAEDGVGVYATRGRPLPGEPFLILARHALRPDFNALRDRGMLSWEFEQPVGEDAAGWDEYLGCLTGRLPEDDGGLSTHAAEILEAIRPARVVPAVSLSGGLRVPRKNCWIGGHEPSFTLHAAAPRAKWTLTNDATPKVKQHEGVAAGYIPFRVPVPLEAGDWTLTIDAPGGTIRRRFFVVEWDSLEPAPELGPQATHWPGATLSGAELRVSADQPDSPEDA